MANASFGVNIIPKNNTVTIGNSDSPWKSVSTKELKANYGNMLVEGTGTAGQTGSSSVDYVPSLWTFNLGFTPSAGDVITIKIPVAGVNAGVWLSINNGTTYYPVATVAKTRLTTQYGADAYLALVYETNATTSIYGTSISGATKGSSVADYVSDRWTVVNGYDSNTTYTAMTSSEMITGTKTTARAMSAVNLKAGLQGVLKVASNDVQLYGTHLTGQVPAPTAANNGKILKIASGAYTLANETVELPSVTSSDNGKVLRVVNGAWSASQLPSASGVSF